MAKPRYDLVVEAVHYGTDGRVDWVRAYERRGPVFSDRILIQRDVLIERLKAGDKVVIGTRIPQMSGTFEVSQSVRLMSVDGQELLGAGDAQAGRDNLDGAPQI